MLFVSFPRHAVLDPELFYPDVLMDRWPGVVFAPDVRRVLRCSLFSLQQSFFTPDAVILSLFPGACSFAFDRGVRFPAFFQLASSLLGFSYRETHISIHVFGRLVTSRHNHRYSPVCQ